MTGSIEVDHVSKRFVLNGDAGMDLREKFSPRFRRSARALPREEFWALEDVSFRVLPGETLGIVGHNGSGKSTLLKILTGILQPTRGKVRVQGRVGALIEVGAGFHPDLTGRENVFLNGSLLGLKRAEIARKFDSIVHFAELERFIDTPVKRYSTGMYMRLGFAIAAHVDPDILLVDEVLAVGDMAFQVKCMDRVREMSAAGTTIVFVSHSMDAVAKICRQAVLLDGGRVVAAGTTEMVVNAYQRQMTQQIAAVYREADENPPAESAAPEQSAAPPPLRIVHVELYDARNQACRTFQVGDTLTIRMTYEADRPIRDCVFGVGLNRVDGIVCYGPNTLVDKIPLAVEAGAGRVEVTFADLPLLADSYSVAVATLEGEELLEYREGLCRFLVQDERGERGVCRLPHRWQHYREETAPLPLRSGIVEH